MVQEEKTRIVRNATFMVDGFSTLQARMGVGEIPHINWLASQNLHRAQKRNITKKNTHAHTKKTKDSKQQAASNKQATIN